MKKLNGAPKSKRSLSNTAIYGPLKVSPLTLISHWLQTVSDQNVFFCIYSIHLTECFPVTVDWIEMNGTVTQIRCCLCGLPSKFFSVTETSGISFFLSWINKEMQDFDQI